MSLPISNPLQGMMARQQGVTDAAYTRWRIQRARTLWALATMLVAACLLVLGASLAWGWPGGLMAAGGSLGTFGVLLGLTSAVPES